MQRLLSFQPVYPLEIVEGVPGYTEIYPWRACLFGPGFPLLNSTHLGVDMYGMRYLYEIGVGPHPDNAVVLEGDSPMPQARLLESQNRGILRRFEGFELDCYTLRGPDAELAKSLGYNPAFVDRQEELSYLADDKIWLRETARKLGLEEHVIPGGIASHRASALHTFRGHITFCDSVVLLTNTTLGGGAAFHRLTTEKQLLQVFDDLRWGNEFPHDVLLTRYVKRASSPSIQYKCTDGGAVEVGVTTQILTEFTHEGNFSPAVLTPGQYAVAREITLPIAQHLYEMGYRGDLGFDLIEPKDKSLGDDFLYLQEVNPRKVAPEFMRQVQRVSGHESVLMMNVHPNRRMTSAEIHRRLQEAGLLYGCASKGAVVPYMTLGGKLQDPLQPKFAVMSLGTNLSEAVKKAWGVKNLFGDKTNIDLPSVSLNGSGR